MTTLEFVTYILIAIDLKIFENINNKIENNKTKIYINHIPSCTVQTH